MILKCESWKWQIRKLRIYKIYKRNVEEINWFDNTVKMKFLIKARTDAVDSNWTGRFKNRYTKCMCGYISETLEHFSLYCIVNWHNDLRIKYAILQQPYIENECELMSHILCFRNCGKRRQKIVKKKINGYLNFGKSGKLKQAYQ